MKPKTITAMAAGFAAMLSTAAALGQNPKQAAPATAPAATTAAPKDMLEKVSYGLGMSVAKNFQGQAIDVNADIFARGFKDTLAGAKSPYTDEQIQEALQAYEKVLTARQQQLAAKQAAEAKVSGDKNKQDGDTFLAANKAKPGVVTLPSGLQYKVVKDGTGKTPAATSTVTTHYRGTLIDGTEFDSSYKRGEPASFPVNGVIPGWTEALQKMKVGSKWQLFIPPNLAYGMNPPPGSPIGPNAVLVFDIELLGVQ
jgi:FKBP-type peptidyl-prolyl cis-trans isomerase